VAESAAADLVQLRCTAPAGVAERRIRARAQDPSDANPEITKRMAAAQGPWPEAIAIDTTNAEDSLTQAMTAIRPPGPEDLWQPERPYMTPG
jgi:predicted kinase